MADSRLNNNTITTDNLVYNGANTASFVTYRRNLMRWLVPEVGMVENTQH